MDTKAIESMIGQLCADAGAEPELRDVLAVVAERRGARPGSEDLERGVQFVIAYIEQVPYMMKVAWTAACNVGLEPEMRRILEMVDSYWREGDDIIPDELGVVGHVLIQEWRVVPAHDLVVLLDHLLDDLWRGCGASNQ